MSFSSRERFREIDEIFGAALDLPPNERDAFVARTCGDDEALRDGVRRLLDAHGRVGDFLEAPAAEIAPELVIEPSPTPAPPHHAGPFRIVRELGHGGMGVVYLAEREGAAFQQRVALKLVSHLGGGDAVQRRFREEQRILALLEHPGIARLIDGGVTDEGLSWFAMELVEGEPIDSYCDRRRLTLDERLELFDGICDAVQYAHEHLIIHRDIKPSNILVRDDGQLKLLDFGIAKLLDPFHSTEDSLHTGTGMLVLTPEYAAPEQVRGLQVSTATDTYSLGVLLYALLTGRRPYDVRDRPPADIERIVCELEPPRPSATVGGAHNEEKARTRTSTPEKLRRRLRGDLDVIVMKALRKDPARRYSSIAAFRDDLNRFRKGLPVLARPDSAGYRLRKFARRNRWALAGAGSLVILLAGYAATVTVQSARIRRALAEARLGTHRAEQVTDYMLGLFKGSEGGRLLTDTVRARELLDRGVAQARALSGQPELQAQLLDVIGRIQTYLGEYDRATPLLVEALTIRRTLHGESHADVATSLESLAEATGRDVAAALELRRQALALRRQLSGADNSKTTDALFELALALHRAGDVSAAKPLFDQWMTNIAQQPRELTPERASQLTTVGKFLEYGGRPDRAEPLLREALAVNRALYGEQHHEVGSSLAHLGVLLDRARRLEEADSVLRQAVRIHRTTYPQGHPELAATLRAWGIALEHMKRFSAALAPLREALDIRRRFLGNDAVDIAVAETDLAYALIMSGTYDEPAVLARDAVRILRRQLGDDNAMVAHARAHLGDALRGQGKLAEAEPLLLAAYAKLDPPKPVTRQWRGYAIAALVRLNEAKGRPEEAAKYRALMNPSGR